MFKSEKGLADSLAAEMESILGSDEHRAVFAKPAPVVKTASAEEEAEDNQDADDKEASKEEISTSAKFEAAVKGVAKISEVLDELGLPKSSLATLNALNVLVAEAEEHYAKDDDDKEDDDKKDEDDDDGKKDDDDDDDEEDDNDASDKKPVELPKDMTKVPSDPEVKERGTHHSRPQLDQYRKDRDESKADDKKPVELPKDMTKVPSDPEVKERGTHYSKPQLDQYRDSKDDSKADDYDVDGASEPTKIEQRLTTTDLHYDDDGAVEGSKDENNVEDPAEESESPKAEGLIGDNGPGAERHSKGDEFDYMEDNVGEDIRSIMEELGLHEEEEYEFGDPEEPGLMEEFRSHDDEEYYDIDDAPTVVATKKWKTIK